jgi:prepilin signal peptidase PulO-like enzyme (type II secretory pathway)
LHFNAKPKAATYNFAVEGEYDLFAKYAIKFAICQTGGGDIAFNQYRNDKTNSESFVTYLFIKIRSSIVHCCILFSIFCPTEGWLIYLFKCRTCGTPYNLVMPFNICLIIKECVVSLISLHFNAKPKAATYNFAVEGEYDLFAKYRQ